jgi:propanol-preferring alcohol dehydrogenase
MEPSGIVPEHIRRKGLTLKGGRGASEGALRTAMDIVTAEANRLSGIVGESVGFEAAESTLKGLLNGRVARGAHVVIMSDASRRAP